MSLAKAVDLVVTDPPYIIRRVRVDQQSNHDTFSVDATRQSGVSAGK